MSSQQSGKVSLDKPVRDARRRYRPRLPVDEFEFRTAAVAGPGDKLGDTHARYREFRNGAQSGLSAFACVRIAS